MGAAIGGITALLAVLLLAWLSAPTPGDASGLADRPALAFEVIPATSSVDSKET